MFEAKRGKAKCNDCEDQIIFKDMKPHEIKYCRCKAKKMRVVKLKDGVDITKDKYSETIYNKTELKTGTNERRI